MKRKAFVLKENKDFRRIYAKGKSFVSPVLVTYVLHKKQGDLRLGITASKKVGKAVVRNRARRVIKEACRMVLKGNESPCDLVFVARSSTASFKAQEIAIQMQEHLRAAHV